MSKYQKLNYLRTEKTYTVYLGQYEQEKVILKLLSSSFAVRKGFEERFVAEGKKLVNIVHDNLIEYLDFYKDNFQYTIVQRFFEANKLSDYLKENKFTAGEVKKYFLQLLSAVGHLHENGIVNGHIELTNLWIDNDKILLDDYGLIPVLYGTYKQKEKGLVLTPPRFCSPEEIKGEEIDQRSDIYSLGVLLYSFVEGVEPYFNIYSTSDLARKIVEEPLPPLSRFKFLEPVINKATDKNIDKRYQSVGEFIEAVKALEFVEEPKAEKQKFLVAESEQSEDKIPEETETKVTGEVIREDEIKIITEDKQVVSSETEYTEENIIIENDFSTQTGGDTPEPEAPKKVKAGCLGSIFIFILLTFLVAFLVILFGNASNKGRDIVIDHSDSYGYKLFDMNGNKLAIIGLNDYGDSLLFTIVDKKAGTVEQAFSIYNSKINYLAFDDTVFYKLGREYLADSGVYLPSLSYIYTNGTYEDYFGKRYHSLDVIKPHGNKLSILVRSFNDSVYNIEVYTKMLNLENIYKLAEVDFSLKPNDLVLWNNGYVVELYNDDVAYLYAYGGNGKFLWRDTLSVNNYQFILMDEKNNNMVVTKDKLYVFGNDDDNIVMYVRDKNGNSERKLIPVDVYYPNIYSVTSDSSGFYLVGNYSEGEAFVVKIDYSGNLLWTQIKSNTNNYRFVDVIVDSNKVLILGSKESFWDSNYKMCLFAFTQDGKPVKLEFNKSDKN